MLIKKKGIALNQAFTAVLTLVLVGVLVIIGIVIFVSLNSSFAGTSTALANNESITPNDAGVRLASAVNCSSNNFITNNVLNATGIPITSGNYTLAADTGILTNLTSEFIGSWDVSYDYKWGSEACTASADMVTQFATYPALVGLVGTIIFLGIVIGVLVASFVFGRRSGF